jgi:hypothetical protein
MRHIFLICNSVNSGLIQFIQGLRLYWGLIIDIVSFLHSIERGSTPMHSSRLIASVSFRKHIEVLQLLEISSSHKHLLLVHGRYLVARCLGGVSVTCVVVNLFVLDAMLTLLILTDILAVLCIWAQVPFLIVLLNWGRRLGNNFVNSTICVYFGHLARKSGLKI